MRVPLVRFGNDDRPSEPWEERLAPVVLPLVIPLLFAAVVLMSAVGVGLVLGWAALSRVLPRSWRLNGDTALDLDPSALARCSACQACLSLGPVDKRGQVAETDQGRQIVMPAQAAQAATCPQCQRAFRRFSLGKVWSSWQEAQTPNN